MNKSNKLFFLSILLFISIIFSYVFFEDTLGGARQDYLFHEKFIVLFADDFKNTFSNYGDADLFARNSPIFYILFSFLYKIGIDLESLRYLNIVSIPLLIYIFYNCLEIQFRNINKSLLMLMSLVVFLSPTIRSLVVWPYPILYGFILFLFSIKFYLKFNKEKQNKIVNAFGNIFFLALASYITPNFCVFAIFFLHRFYLVFKKTKYFFYVLFFNLLLATPALIYYYINDFYLIKYSVGIVGPEIKFNIFNKVIIILSLALFYYLPFINKKNLKNTFNVLKNFKNEIFLITFSLLSIYFFNFPYGNFGGGIFLHISQFIIKNNLILFIVFIFSIFTFKASKLMNFNNVLLFVCLVLYNLQVSIYHKYFDPLLLFIFLFLISNLKINNQKFFLEITKKFYLLYLVFLSISFLKIIIL